MPEEARTSLSESEVKRQTAIFEIIKTEKEYVADLEAPRDVSSILSGVHRPLIALGVIDRFPQTALRRPLTDYWFRKADPVPR